MAFATIATAADFLHTSGEDIVNESGQKVILRGVGLGNWMLPEGYMWRFGGGADRPRRIEKLVADLAGAEYAEKFWKEYRRNYITESDIARIAELGFNSVRPALNSRLFMSEDDGSFREEGFDLLDNLIKWCKVHDVYVIIDMHGAPGGQTGQNIDDSADDQPLLFIDTKYQDRLVSLWVKIAARYKDDTTVAAYDLLNEPLPERTGAAKKYKDQLEPLYQRVAKAIREVDQKHMITVEGCNWANDWSVFTKPFDENLVYQFHYYCWDNPTELKSIRHYVAERNRLGAPVWVGETGERDDAIYWATTQNFEANNIGWSFWPWKKMSGNNCPYTIKPPLGREAVVLYSRTRDNSNLSKDAAQKIFDELLGNIRLEHCVFHPDVVNALFHRVPGKVEAENYGAGGQDHSFHVKDPGQRSGLYRKSEGVLIDLLERPNAKKPDAEKADSEKADSEKTGSEKSPTGNNVAQPRRRRDEAGQCVRLYQGDWITYDINSLESKPYSLNIKVKTDSLPAAFSIAVNDASPEKSQKVAISEKGGWHELKLNPVELIKGANRVKLTIDAGTVSIDWLDFESASE